MLDLLVCNLGQYPLSIGTSLAFEGFFGEHPDQKPLPSGYRAINSMYINVQTLVRNYLSSNPMFESGKPATAEAIAEAVVREMAIIPEILAGKGLNYEVVFYYEDLEELKWIFRNFIPKEPKTDLQRMNRAKETVVTNMVLKLNDQIMPIKKRPPLSPKVVAIITHMPHQLLWAPQFNRLFLLESNTGKLKTSNLFYTKLNGIKEGMAMVFSSFTLQVFGDGNYIEGETREVKNALKELAADKKWTAMTTDSKVLDNIIHSPSRPLREAFARCTGFKF